ncbi:hypothetical protein [Nocardia sp. NPDC019302]|uniref:hypothetical protein n=1 Tax=Nocardia sp. NPDC019302 TaxID=3154592 RepID=UPI0033F3265D
MSDTVRVEISVGDPADIALCPRCLHTCLCTLPITGLAETGVIPLGNITACAECDNFTDVVRKFLAGLNT